jgi:hypothetical protein
MTTGGDGGTASLTGHGYQQETNPACARTDFDAKYVRTADLEPAGEAGARPSLAICRRRLALNVLEH